MSRRQRVTSCLGRSKASSVMNTMLPFMVAVCVWALVVWAFKLPSFALPSPASVYQRGVQLIVDGTLAGHAAQSLIRLLAGAFVSIVLAVPLGVTMGLHRAMSDFFTPLLSFFQSISGIAWIPLATIWFGFGFPTILFVLVNCIFFPVLYNTVMGVRGVPACLCNAARCLGATNWQVITHVVLPGALPSIMTGLRMGTGFGWRALMAAEMIATEKGLGYMIFDARLFWRTDEVIVGMIGIGSIWFLTDRLILIPLERKTIERWGLVTTST